MEMININLKTRKMLLSDLSLLNNMGPSQINYAKSFYIKARYNLKVQGPTYRGRFAMIRALKITQNLRLEQWV